MKYIKLFENFTQWFMKSDLKDELDLYGIKNYTINDDGTVDVNGNVIIFRGHPFRSKHTKIPFKFGKVTGNFLCNGNALESLEGSPYYVGGDFSCGNNSGLKNFKGSPVEVACNFIATGLSNLESLEGLSPEIGGSLYIHKNPKLKEIDSISNIEGAIFCDVNIDVSKFSGYCEKFIRVA